MSRPGGASLEHMMVLMHLGSGQPARKPEYLGMRWCNKASDKRNLFVHDGYVLFILTYHKSLAMSNASRWPVRFLLPTVGELLVRYLVLVQPFRIWLKEEVSIPEDVSEYLWSHGAEAWTENQMTKILASETKAVLGIRINVQSWRQMAAGIAIKKSGKLRYPVEADLDSDDDSDDDRDGDLKGPAMPDAFHWQASHTPRTGNQVYGGTVNFQHGLTDAGLQEFRRASQLWHGLCMTTTAEEEEAQGTRRRGSRKHGREDSNPGAAPDWPLAKRVAFRKAPLRHRRRWTMAEAQRALEALYGPGARYRSQKQADAMQLVLDGIGQVVAVLGTGEGKSLLYMLPSRLRGAGTTVVIVPLIGLKQDLIRRCEEMRLGYKVWVAREEEGGRIVGCALVLVSAEEAVSKAFLKYLNRLEAGNALDRVVFDKSHLVLTASEYRPKMRLIRELRGLRCQFLFLTATLPPSMLGQFERKVLLSRPSVVRSSTLRADLDYNARRSGGRDLQRFALDEVRQVLQLDWFAGEAGARCIVYTATWADADAVAERLGCQRYSSDSGHEAAKAAALSVMSKWDERRYHLFVSAEVLPTAA